MRRISGPALVAFDLLALCAYLAIFARAMAIKPESAGVGCLPRDADARVLALDLFEAQRQAIVSGRPVEVRFERDRHGKTVAYRVVLSARPIGYYRFPARREFQPRLRVTASREQICFWPSPGGVHPAAIIQLAGATRDEVRVDASGRVRLLRGRPIPEGEHTLGVRPADLVLSSAIW
jgi:hypothetical protein